MRVREKPPRIASVLAVAWLTVAVAAFSDAGVSYPLWLAIALGGVLLSGWWLLRLLVAVAVGPRLAIVRGSPIVWLLVPAAIGCGLLAGATFRLLSLRVYLGGDALLASASSLAAVPAADLRANGVWVGGFRVREIQRFDSELRFLTAECGLVDECGVVYSPQGEPPRRGEDSFRHLHGPWWHWYQSW